MNFAGLLFLLVAHYLSGRGLLRVLGFQGGTISSTCLSLMAGVVVISFAPCLLQLLYIPISATTIIACVTGITAVLALPLLRHFKRPVFKAPALPQYYEWPLLLVCGALMLLSMWRCFYYPPYARDMLAGPELVATYAVREHTLINSVFTVDLQSSNNYFKSPFITGLQVVYKLLVCPFGQVWLSIISMPFVVWMYTLLRARIHPILATVLLFLFLAIPELYSYTYLMLYDYSNMVFFFCGYYFLVQYITVGNRRAIFIAACMFGFATYIRAETPVFAGLLAPLLLTGLRKRNVSILRAGANLALIMVVSFLFYALCVHVFVQRFVPLPFTVSGQLSRNPWDLRLFLHRLHDMTFDLVFSAHGTRLFGYYFFLFCLAFLADIPFLRRLNAEARLAVYGVFAIYFGLALLGNLSPLADIDNTTKRGMFKLAPIVLLYLCNSHALQYLSRKLYSINAIKPASAQ